MTVKFEYSAGAFIYTIEKGKVLLLVLRRARDYDIPKGHIEEGETGEQAAIREVKEETGLDIELIPSFSRNIRYFFYRNKTRIIKGVRFFLAETNTKDVKISWEHKGYEWLDRKGAMEKASYKDISRILPDVFAYIAKREEVKRINKEYAAIPDKERKWGLSRNFVPGEGPLDADVMFVGQAPGRQEDERRRPFIGRSGELLSSMMRKARINRKKVYITSVVQFFPPENREPDDREIALCLPLLKRQIAAIAPKYVVLLGNVASKAVAGIGDIKTNHGRTVVIDGVTYFLTFHPAAALRFKDTLALMQEDLKKFRELSQK